MTYNIDCLKNSSYASDINNINNLFLTAPINIKIEKIKCQITIDLYNLYLEATNKPIHAISIFQKGLKKIFNLYLNKIKKIKNKNTNYLKKIKKFTTKNHYSELFTSFNNKNIFIEPEKFLIKRFLRNKINIKKFKSKNAIDMGCGIGRYTFILLF